MVSEGAMLGYQVSDASSIVCRFGTFVDTWVLHALKTQRSPPAETQEERQPLPTIDFCPGSKCFLLKCTWIKIKIANKGEFFPFYLRKKWISTNCHGGKQSVNKDCYQ